MTSNPPVTKSDPEILLSKAEDIKTYTTKPVANHKDEAINIIALYTGNVEWTSTEEKNLIRKIDRRLLVLLTLSYGLQYYDKALLSQAVGLQTETSNESGTNSMGQAIFGLRDDLDLNTGNRYSFSASIFYLGFVAGAIPATLSAQRYPVERVLFTIVCLWGICLLATVGCDSYHALYTQRFFLGFLESGVSPIFMLAVGCFYKKEEQAFRMGVWYSSTGFVAIFSPLINYGLGHITSGALRPWQYMYLVAGIITILWSFLLLFYFPPDPIRAKGYTDRERYIAVARLQSNNSGVRNTHFKKEHLFELLLDTKFWILFAIAFLGMIPNAPGSTFIPIIINGFGFSTLNSLLLYIPYGFISGMATLIVTYLAYRVPRLRCYIIFLGYLTTIISSLLLWRLPRSEKGWLLFSCYIFPFWGFSFALIMGLSTANTAGYTKRSLASSSTTVLCPPQTNEEEMVSAAEEQLDDILEDDIIDEAYILKISIYVEHGIANSRTPVGKHERICYYQGLSDYRKIISTEASGSRLPNIPDEPGRTPVMVSASENLKDRIRDLARGYLHQGIDL